MGGLLALPIGLVSALSVLASKGFIYTIRYTISYVYLIATRWIRGRRFDLYDYRYDNMPEKTGFFIPQEEKVVENPQKSIELKKDDGDDAYCIGFNSKSEQLSVYIARQTNSTVYCSLLLRLSDGTTYSLMDDDILQKETEEENTFGSSRFKIQCLIPMRKWRIFFNGMLKKNSVHGDGQELVHVKFVFLWTASSDVFDYTYDTSIHELAHQTATSKLSWQLPSAEFFHNFEESFNGYEHPGMILGSVSIENEPEIELYLWGARGRYRGKKNLFRNSQLLQVYGTFQDGKVINLSLLNVKNVTKGFYYGYLMRPNGFIYPLENCKQVTEDERCIQFSFDIDGGKEKCDLTVQLTDNNLRKFQKELFKEASLKFVKLNLNSKEGVGCIINGSIACNEKTMTSDKSNSSYFKSDVRTIETADVLSVSFEDASCQNAMLTGGKGSSLGKLYTIINEELSNGDFSVPKGIVVTTKSYEEFTKDHLVTYLENFQKNVWQSNQDDVTGLCKNAVDTVSNQKLPDVVNQSIISNLAKVFGDSYVNIKFAVRSSATGEDTEEISAAGQNETFLGIVGVDEILNAVRKCWASQFTFQAIEYKRHCGQLLNSPMAVVIQEMVPCDVAGVMFTCDPVTGNPAYISITANWGLGESVVSASAEPDTVTVKRDASNKLSIDSKQIGNKKSMVVLNASEGTMTVDVEDKESSSCCISDEEAIMLGKIAVKLEKAFGSPRDIEWGLHNKKTFLFQSRPVTTLDADTDFETRHFFDNYLRCEKEFITKANVGEVMPGATSPLGLDFMSKIFHLVPFRQLIQSDGEAIPNVPYFAKRMTFSYNNIFINLIDGFIRYTSDGDLMVAKSFLISLFGRVIDDKEMRQTAWERHHVPGKQTTMPLILKLYTLSHIFTSGYLCNRFRKTLEQFRGIPYKAKNDPGDILYSIACHYQITVEGMLNLMRCSTKSSIFNMAIITLLARAKGDFDSDVYSDFAYLLSTCTDVESADVPAAIQDLGYCISRNIEPQKFKHMSVEEALNWLQTTKSAAGKKFRNFLTRHGHRCLKEFDVHSRTWGSDPTLLVQTLQSLVSKDMKAAGVKTVPLFSEILQNMNIKLGFKDRLKLRFILPNTKDGVRLRERSKAQCIKCIDFMRKPLELLSDIMVKEGRLPKKELLYFMCVAEIHKLIETRSPRIIARAYRRMKVHPELDKLAFPEICTGIPKPINEEQDEIMVNREVGLSMTGTPVSKGIVKGIARVVPTLQDAVNIQSGDIMITYSTDIGWTPYFTLLSGVVTELGGLISHGAVVAREYGLPCIVGLHGATRAFKSGDIVILDGNKGILQKIGDENGPKL